MNARLHRLWLGIVLAGLSLNLTSMTLADDATWSGEITSDDPVWTWYFEEYGSTYYYDVCEFSVGADGEYTIAMIGGNLEDADLTLSYAPFVPDKVAQDYIAYAVASGGGPVIQEQLDAGVKYALTTSTYYTEETGSYTNRINGPGQVSIYCKSDAGSGNGPAPIAGNLLDGRINNSSAFDVAAPVAVYCAEDGGFDVYAIDPDSGDGTLVARVTAADIEAMTPLNGAHEALGGGSGVTLYRLLTGGFQVSANTADGKLYRFVWDACPPTNKQWPV